MDHGEQRFRLSGQLRTTKRSLQAATEFICPMLTAVQEHSPHSCLITNELQTSRLSVSTFKTFVLDAVAQNLCNPMYIFSFV